QVEGIAKKHPVIPEPIWLGLFRFEKYLNEFTVCKSLQLLERAMELLNNENKILQHLMLQTLWGNHEEFLEFSIYEEVGSPCCSSTTDLQVCMWGMQQHPVINLSTTIVAVLTLVIAVRDKIDKTASDDKHAELLKQFAKSGGNTAGIDLAHIRSYLNRTQAPSLPGVGGLGFGQLKEKDRPPLPTRSLPSKGMRPSPTTRRAEPESVIGPVPARFQPKPTCQLKATDIFIVVDNTNNYLNKTILHAGGTKINLLNWLMDQLLDCYQCRNCDKLGEETILKLVTIIFVPQCILWLLKHYYWPEGWRKLPKMGPVELMG
uniref:Uncharacterized protein n=1 Tax=Romanomermis culicivorax TaxID=13658 RepID=A0A915J8X7_ROMCU